MTHPLHARLLLLAAAAALAASLVFALTMAELHDVDARVSSASVEPLRVEAARADGSRAVPVALGERGR